MTAAFDANCRRFQRPVSHFAPRAARAGDDRCTCLGGGCEDVPFTGCRILTVIPTRHQGEFVHYFNISTTFEWAGSESGDTLALQLVQGDRRTHPCRLGDFDCGN